MSIKGASWLNRTGAEYASGAFARALFPGISGLMS